MKLIVLIISFFVTLASGICQENNPNYDDKLAKELGADDYGMKSYKMVILKSGNAKLDDKKLRDSAFRSHFSNIEQLAEQKKLIVAGPISKNEKAYRGIFIFDVKDSTELVQILQKDLTISLGIFDYEVYDWYGSAALVKYFEYSDKIWKNKP